MNGAIIVRRSFLWILTGVCGVSARCRGNQRHAHSNGLLKRVFRARESAVILGAKYLRRGTAERNPHTLRQLLDLPPGEQDLSEDDLDRLASRLAQRHRDDLRHDRTRSLEGWILTLTELRLCALMHLAQ